MPTITNKDITSDSPEYINIAQLYAIEKADEVCGKEKIPSYYWNKEYEKYYVLKMKELQYTNELALSWWKSIFDYQKRYDIANKYLASEVLGTIDPTFLSDKEIVEIYRREIASQDTTKSTQPQFFDDVLVKCYIDKFSEINQANIFDILLFDYLLKKHTLEEIESHIRQEYLKRIQK